MSVKELEDRVQALPPRELEQFCRWFEDYRRQVLGKESEDSDSEENLTEGDRAELLRRVEFAKAHPEALEPWGGTTDAIRERLHALQVKKATRRGN